MSNHRARASPERCAPLEASLETDRRGFRGCFPFGYYSQARVGKINDQSRWRIERLYVRDYGAAGQNFDCRYAAFANDANAFHERRRPKRLALHERGDERHHDPEAHRFEPRSRQTILHWRLEGNISLARMREK